MLIAEGCEHRYENQVSLEKHFGQNQYGKIDVVMGDLSVVTYKNKASSCVLLQSI